MVHGVERDRPKRRKTWGVGGGTRKEEKIGGGGGGGG